MARCPRCSGVAKKRKDEDGYYYNCDMHGYIRHTLGSYRKEKFTSNDKTTDDNNTQTK